MGGLCMGSYASAALPKAHGSQAGQETLRRQEDLRRLSCWPEAVLTLGEAAQGTSGAGRVRSPPVSWRERRGLGCFTFRAARQRRGSGGASSGGGGAALAPGDVQRRCRSGAGLRGGDKGCGTSLSLGHLLTWPSLNASRFSRLGTPALHLPFSQLAFVCLFMCFLSVFVYRTKIFAAQQITIFLRVAQHLFSGEWGVSAVTCV